jgi:ATP-dependent Clp protease ATP-binding subunit ClpC
LLPQVGDADVTRSVSLLTGVPVAKLTETEVDRIQHMEEHLHERIVGQDEAISAVSRAIRRAKAGKSASTTWP